MTPGLLHTPAAARTFMFAGNATITLASDKTGQRFTYRVRKSEDGERYFVGLMIGPDNDVDYQYLGFFRDGRYVRGTKSKIGADAPSAKAFAWFAAQLNADSFKSGLWVFHEGRCGACGRKLTVPSSVAAGIGPDCAERLGIVCEDPVKPAVDPLSIPDFLDRRPAA